MMRPLWAGILRVAALYAFVLALQWGAGAYQSEGAGDPDEPAHLVTGLMAREYLASGWPHGPVSFARDYYLHYPKVAIGHWPPVFYAEQAAWTLVFPSSRPSLLAMIALQSALILAIVWPVLRLRFGSAAAWIAVIVLATLPRFATQGAMIMTEIPVVLLILLAMLSWSKYLDTARPWHAVAFGLWSAAAILAKGTGLVLVGVPLLSLWLAGRANLLRRVWSWLPALVVFVLCAPWYLLAPGAMQERVSPYGGLGLSTKHLSFPLVHWADQFGWIVTILTFAGLLILLYRRATGSPLDGTWASAAALVIAAILFPMFFTSWEYRHLVEAAPAFVMVAAAGVGGIASWAPFRGLGAAPKLAILVLASLASISWSVSRLERQQPRGYRQLTEAILDHSLGSAQTIVISGDSEAEGLLISEVAQRERRPQRFLLRGTKVFADVGWMGRVTDLRVKNAVEAEALLTSLPVDLVVIDRVAPSPYGYQPAVEQALAGHPDHWQAVEHGAAGQRFGIFHRIGGAVFTSSEVETRLKAALPEPVLR